MVRRSTRCKICGQPLDAEFLMGVKRNPQRVYWFFICHRHDLRVVSGQAGMKDRKLLHG